MSIQTVLKRILLHFFIININSIKYNKKNNNKILEK